MPDENAYPPSPEFVKHANVSGIEQYRDLYTRALEHPEQFWGELAEREPHAAIYGTLDAILDRLDDPLIAAASIARFELAFLAELGFGLDLSSCAATGTTSDLIYVSPRSGRAGWRSGGEDYRDKLLALPTFLRDDAAPASGSEYGMSPFTPSSTSGTMPSPWSAC